jgi:hypothetical protein
VKARLSVGKSCESFFLPISERWQVNRLFSWGGLIDFPKFFLFNAVENL